MKTKRKKIRRDTNSNSPKARKLRDALAVLGHTDIVLWWEPIGPALEMCGNSGGYIFYSAQEPGWQPLGLSFDEAKASLHLFRVKAAA